MGPSAPGPRRAPAPRGAVDPSPSASDPSRESSEPSSTPSREESASPSPSASTSSPSPTGTPSSSAGTPTAAELEDAITGYYTLVPDDTGAAWDRLTAGYQSGTSGGRKSYDSFWAQVDRVSVSKVDATPPSRVEASITYVRGGRTEVDRTSFRLVREDGVLKIAASSVLSTG